ncbi:endo-1,4-beta-xylanase [Brachybacterium alimentarium]|uniref:Beta-xylanase n=1 Tax=Brachybacterium alimentarium TaxID=47845 RepID=A0A2A3YP73_9MICO|nr:endo-1,4-beta-xylanase [Brachybacterium alimentarium]PCC35458.1 1,4-beta-xylanase [Brachybacterium alimentarium]PCC41078.1 1,4-beta-xylanase [Brachybacterium alimentarium]RCS74644.1 1,4-beta-xylanase [Brachybacterium alimentarium]RCS81602.1 1,4-beta-xylanase [Brachybacterium alimentarium]RCS82117.1 1,4-beta-xylanase [Brachybacterium alimentarium]
MAAASSAARRASAPAGRLEPLELHVVDAAGAPRPGALVTVEQTRHAFGFGCTAFTLAQSGDPEAAELERLWLGLFDTATLPFYWRWYEQTPGTTDADRLRALALHLRDRGVRIKGHPLLWHTLAPTWLLEKDDQGVEEAIRARITREAREFAGLVDQWDALNETVILPVFAAEENAVTRLAQARGRMHVIRLAVETARAADPTAQLVLNDFDLTPAYEHVLEECLEAGVRIDAIGLQTHMHQGYRGEEQIAEVLERFSRFGLPLQMTETTLVSGDLMPSHIDDLNDYVVASWPSTPDGEERQADELVRHYRTVLAHPAVESLTYWGLDDASAWLGAPAGLVRRDGTPKPSYHALQELVREQWWVHRDEHRADEHGVVRLEGFAGDYRVQLDGQSQEITVPRGGLVSRLVPSSAPRRD